MGGRENVVSAYITGFLMSDGSVLVDEARGVGRIKLTTKDPVLIREFEEAIKSYYLGRDVNIIKVPKGRAIDVVLYDLAFAKKFVDLTKGKAEIPVGIINEDVEVKRAFLRSYCSCDGGITIASKKRRGKVYWDVRLVIGEGNDRIRAQVSELLREFGVAVVDDGHKHLRTRYNDLRSLINFKKHIGFIDGVRPVKGRFTTESLALKGGEEVRHLTKNQLLEYGITLLQPLLPRAERRVRTPPWSARAKAGLTRPCIVRGLVGKPRPSERSCPLQWGPGMTEKLPRG